MRPYGCCLAAYLVAIVTTGLVKGGALSWADCGCPAGYDPVCSKSFTTYPNACIANCVVGSNANWTKGSCNYENPFDKCTNETAVICMGDPCVVTSSGYAGALTASCQSVRCTGAETWNLTNPKPIAPCSAVWNPPGGVPFVRTTSLTFIPATQCKCNSVYSPVCGRDNQTYANACAAGCAGVDVAARGVCGASGAGGCECPARAGQPVCGSDNRTYESICEAACEGVLVQYPGSCVDTAQRMPPTSSFPARPVAPGLLTQPPPSGPPPPPGSPPPSSSSTMPSPPSPGPPPHWHTASPPPCIPLPEWPPEGPPSEPADAPINYTPPNRPPIPSQLPLVPPIVQRPPAAQNATSAPSPLRARDPPPPSPPPTSPCASCPTYYEAVCGVDYKNYPHKCIADCLGVKIKKAGKCNHCNGEECLIGKRNDLCVLAVPTAKQCWYGKFECKPAVDVKQGDVLGKCQLRPAVPPSPAPPHKSGRRLI